MKQNINIYIGLLLSITAIYSCGEMDDSYREFIEDGETVYVGRADSLLVQGGDERAQISWLLLSDPKVIGYKLFWNSREDSLSGDLVKTENVDTVRLMVEGLEEKSHEFEVYLFDKHGNTSVTSSSIGKVYGSRYQSSLFDRLYTEAQMVDDEGLELDWSFAEETLLFSEIKYQDIDGENIVHIVPKEAELDTLRNFPEGGTIQLRTAFLPDTMAIDTFYTEYQELTPIEQDDTDVE